MYSRYYMICTNKKKQKQGLFFGELIVFIIISYTVSFQMICLEKNFQIQIEYMSTSTKPKVRFYSNESQVKFQHAVFTASKIFENI